MGCILSNIFFTVTNSLLVGKPPELEFSCQLDADQDGANLDTPDLDTGLLNIVMDSIRYRYNREKNKT